MFSTAELMFTFDVKERPNIHDFYDFMNIVSTIGMLACGVVNMNAMEKIASESGINAAEDLVFIGSSEVVSSVEPALQGLSEDAIESENIIEEQGLVKLLNASDTAELEAIKTDILAEARVAADAETNIVKELQTEPDAIFEYVTETTDKGDYIECKTADSIKTGVPKDALTEEEAKCLEDGCFTGKTLVQTSTGLRRIDSLKIGDLVLSKDTKTGAEAYKKVLTVYKKTTNELYVMNVDGENVTTTSGHLFMMSTGLWKSAKNIHAGDKITDADGTLKEVKDIEVKKSEDYTRIYNLNVEDYHTYFVGSKRLLVHNNCGIDLDKLANETGKSYETLIDENLGNTVYINGKRISLPSAPHSNSTPGHWETMVDKSIELTQDSDVKEIWLNKGLSNIKEINEIDPNRSPDIMVKRLDGKIDQYEVPSKTDDPQALIARMIDNQRILGDKAGNYFIEYIP